MADYGHRMAHEIMFDDSDPVLARVRALALALPAAAEKVSHGRPCFFTKKIFVIYGATTKGDHHDGRRDTAMIFMPHPAESVALLQDPRFFTPAYWGPYGWLATDLAESTTDWEEVAELIEESFRQTAPPKLVTQLESAATE